MADTKRRRLKTIKTNYEELDEKILAHKKMMTKRVLVIALIVAAFVVGINILYALRTYDSYEVTSTTSRSGSDVTRYAQFQDCLLEYSNDGISCVSADSIIWNQAFEMVSPQIEICEGYLVVYDAGGTRLYIMTLNGLEKEIQTASPIQKVCIANQGTVAVLMKESNESQVKLFDKKGNELANGKFYSQKGGFPVDIALSYDATKLAVDMIDVTAGKVSTTISFYNFGAVGQSQIDNNVGAYTFENILIPEIDYVSATKMIGIGTGKIVVFEGSQKPELKKEIVVEKEILSCFHNEKYIGVVYDNAGVENSWHIQVMDLSGKTVMESDIAIAYERIEFLENGEICVSNLTECEIFTMHGIKKFSYKFDKEILQILSVNGAKNYTFIFKDTIEEVKLK